MDRINLITLGVKDLTESVEFYRNLGFEPSIMGHEDEIEIVFFRMNGSKLALYPMEKLAAETGHEAGFAKGEFNGITLAFNAKSEKEVDRILKDVTMYGGEVVRKAAPTEWGGYGGYFTDLDGYYWEVAYGADWEFDENDMLII
ncbi:VOC family protein [Lacicoccus alkaliphilus]|uniref:VOC domain-containing protein n=1 Tax=Lacicoccus alkaliphilus DSM 16010 TaxID=1123231 RepID=A0A1M7BUD4_9BACL|nr:VOC family protein [Salinicoccus alkaliphilus]SHL58590.1 hypothetical protein SAMN02745189_00594 [Salinicoccus alkaliphilus DSM 16010]